MSEKGATLVDEAQARTQSKDYLDPISKCYDEGNQITGSGVDSAIQGKVRDRIYLDNNKVALVTTDRQSGFDRQLALVPFKGAVLNLTSGFWFEQTKHIIPNHVISLPHPYVTIAKKCEPFPIEFVVRYVTTTISALEIMTSPELSREFWIIHSLILLLLLCSSSPQLLHDGFHFDVDMEKLSRWSPTILWS